MKFNCSYTELVDTHKLVPHPKNPNKHTDQQIDRLSKIIDFQGQRHPVIVSKTSGFIVAGHGRLQSMQKLGWEKVAVDYQEFENEAQEYAFLVADNAIAEWSALDLSQINMDFLELGPELDLDQLGIKDFVVEPIEKLEPQSDEDEVPELKEEPVTKRGDIWLLGNHRVMCGDSTMVSDIEKLMAGEKAESVFTDPPYGMGLGKFNGEINSVIKGDNDDFSKELIQVFLGVFGYCKEVFIFGADYFAELIPNRNEGSFLVWNKRPNEDMQKMFGSNFELCWSKNRHKREIISVMKNTIENSLENPIGVHPTQKPIKLIEFFIERYLSVVSIIVDPFLGSGSTIIACEKNNKKCYGIELDELYCDVIINRWQKYTGKQAILESTNQTYDELKAAKHG